MIDSLQFRSRLKTVGLNLDNGYGCVLRLLLTPNVQFMEDVFPHAQKILHKQSYFYGAHVRYGDDLSFSNLELPKEELVAIADRLLYNIDYAVSCFPSRNSRIPKLLLLIDSPAVKQAIPMSSYQLQNIQLIILTGKKPVHVALVDDYNSMDAAFQTAFAEWYLLSLCSEHILTVDSGFSRSAYAYGRSDKAYHAAINDPMKTVHNCIDIASTYNMASDITFTRGI